MTIEAMTRSCLGIREIGARERTTSTATAAAFLALRERRYRAGRPAKRREIINASHGGHTFSLVTIRRADGLEHAWSCTCGQRSKGSWPAAKRARYAWGDHLRNVVPRRGDGSGQPPAPRR